MGLQPPHVWFACRSCGSLRPFRHASVRSSLTAPAPPLPLPFCRLPCCLLQSKGGLSATCLMEEYLDGPEVDIDLVLSQGEPVCESRCDAAVQQCSCAAVGRVS
jgi:hypothetical protein